MKLKTNFKKILFIVSTLLLILLNNSFVFANNTKPQIVSGAAILMDNKTNKILYNKNENAKMYPASTTKILTAIITLENCKLDEAVTVSFNSVMSIPEGYSSAFLQVNEELTVEQLLQLLLVHSANDAANVLAEYVGGSIESFVSMMNTKIHELGLSDTHFTNAYGLHDENHYTTAKDLAYIMKYCMNNQDFRKIAGSASCVLPATNKYGTRKYSSTNELIIPTGPNYYKYLTAGKTGYTKEAGDCLVSCSFKDDLELICVILGGKDINGISTRFSETKTLFEYGYNNYSIQPILKENDIVTNIEIQNGTKETRNLDLLAKKSIEALLSSAISTQDIPFDLQISKTIKAPIEQGDVLGKISYSIDGITYEADLIAAHSVEESKLLSFVLKIGTAFLIILIISILFFTRKKKNKSGMI